MTIHEPFVAATDLLLAVLAGTFAWRLLGRPRPAAARAWGWALASTAVASLLGALSHAVGPALPPLAATLLWKATMAAIGGASAGMLIATARATLAAGARRWLVGAALVELALYLVWIALADEFLWAVVDYGVALVVVLALHAAALGRVGGARRIVEAVLLSFVAAVVQQSPLALGPLDHNTLYHLVQAIALVLFYLGARDSGRSAPESPLGSPA